MIEIGPRELLYRLPNGEDGQITITISFKGDAPIYFDDGDVITRRSGEIKISSSWFEKVITLPADDDIQLAMRLMVAADIYIQKICRDNQISLYKVEEGDVSKPLSIFRP